MCGIAGFSGVSGNTMQLTYMLGLGIDERGGHAAGYVSLGPGHKGGIKVGRKLGHWGTASDKFLRKASKGHTTMLHARFATSGGRGVQEAHPFEIVREGEPVLWGVHNGCLYNAHESATRNGRKLNVDSAELFELLADDDLAGIQALEGYGVITWVRADSPGVVYLARLSDDGAIYVCDVSDGGVAWGSTRDIVEDALFDSDLESARSYKLETGRVYTLSPSGIFATDEKGVHVSNRVFSPMSYGTLMPGFDHGYDEEEEAFDAWLMSGSVLSFEDWQATQAPAPEGFEEDVVAFDGWQDAMREERLEQQREAEEERLRVLRGC